jgi:hypothetical protein
MLPKTAHHSMTALVKKVIERVRGVSVDLPQMIPVQLLSCFLYNRKS